MPDWFPWALLAATYLLAGATCARHLCLMDSTGRMRRVWPVVLLIWPLLFWVSFP